MSTVEFLFLATGLVSGVLVGMLVGAFAMLLLLDQLLTGGREKP